ncbi:MAG: hypothetical protein WD740_08095 [Anaerolineales bacterium]
MKPPNWQQILFVLLLVVFALYGWAFIQRTVVFAEGTQIHALFDDAMISMQYAKNLAQGQGLVWNAGGERVEGFSNPLWVLLMAGIHVLPIPLAQTSLYVKLISLLFLLLNLAVVKWLAEELTNNKFVPLLAAFFTAFYFPLNNWSLQGMEVGLEALLLSSALLLGVRAFKRNIFSPWMAVLFGLGVLLRMDAAAPALAATAAFAWIDPKRRKEHLIWGLGAVAFVLGTLTLFRINYYGDWLPNTYYLKLGGVSLLLRLSIGLRRFWDFVWASNWVLFAIPLTLPSLDKRKILWPLFAVFLSQVAYSIYVGGDAWEHIGGANRFIAAVMPLFFILFTHTLGYIHDLLLSTGWKKMALATPVASVFLAAFCIFSLFSFNTLLVNDGIAKWTLVEKPVFAESVERYSLMGLALKAVTTQNATIAVVTAGNIPYFSERTSIDLLGKNDAIIARGPVHINSSLFEPGSYRPGHNKWDYAYSIGILQPDVVAQIWENTDEQFAPYLVTYQLYVIDGIPYYFREGSESILWDLIPPQK